MPRLHQISEFAVGLMRSLSAAILTGPNGVVVAENAGQKR
jgi:hypothetical protein